MDKRLLIALLLTAIIVAVTPVLFPTPKRTPTTASVSSQRVSDSAVSAKPVQAVNETAPARVGMVTDSTSVAPVSQSAQGRVVTIDTERASYQFATLGAAPVSVLMKNYRNLSPTNGQVVLKVPGQELLTYALVTGRDTVRLRNTDFQVSQASGPTGETSVTFRGIANGLGVTISYHIVPQKYVMRVSGRVDNSPAQTFLLIDRPSSLPVTEADTLGDLRNRSYSFKPTTSNARGIPFGKLDPGEKRLEAEPLTWAAVSYTHLRAHET